jgi:hypothetical protein
MIRRVAWIVAGVLTSIAALLGAASPASADPGCRQYNDRGVCVIFVELPGDKNPKKPPPADSNDLTIQRDGCRSAARRAR